jgi:hypothetical protein
MASTIIAVLLNQRVTQVSVYEQVQVSSSSSNNEIDIDIILLQYTKKSFIEGSVQSVKQADKIETLEKVRVTCCNKYKKKF